MKYVIMCGGYYEQWQTPKQLQIINGERIVERTIRLLKENGAADIYISSNDERFDDLGVERLEHENSYRYENGKLNGYWLDAFYPHFNKRTKVTFIFGDVYFTEEAIKKIINCNRAGNILFGSKGALVPNKVWGEPFAYIVNDLTTFYEGVAAVKKLQDEGYTKRVPIVWELYRYLNGIDVNTHQVKEETYVVIDDGTNDCDSKEKLQTLKDRFEIKGNVFTVISLNEIGGGESFLYYLARKYAKRDITIYYTNENANAAQIERLEKYARVIHFTGQKIRCKKAFFNYNQACINNIEAEEYYQIIHVNYKFNNLKPKPTDKPLKFISVSKRAADTFKEQTGLDSEIVYNPFIAPTPPQESVKPIIIMSATRLTNNKGRERTEKLARILQENGVNFEWYIYTNSIDKIQMSNIHYKKPCLNITDYMSDVTWFAQLSSEEAYGYSVVEANCQGIPVLMTPCPVFKELGIQGLTLDFDLKDVPIDKIKKGMNVESFLPPADSWDKILTDDKSTYIPPDDNDKFLIRIIRRYYDIELKRFVNQGEQLSIIRKRMNTLKSNGVMFSIIREV